MTTTFPTAMAPRHSDTTFFVGVDLGGTNIKAGVVSENCKVISRVIVPTEAVCGPSHTVGQIQNAIELAIRHAGLSMSGIHSIGLASPGPMDIHSGMMLHPHNFSGWGNVPIQRLVAERCQLPTVFQNDANAAAYGELIAGAGKGARSLVMFTLGTGVGCGIIVDGRIIEGRHSHGGECGHIIIEMDNGRLCESGQYGTLEAYASATALVQRCQEALDSGQPSVLSDHSRDDLTALAIANAADGGDELADRLVMETARCLGVGATTLMHTIDPDTILIGGGMTFGKKSTKIGRRFLQRICDEVQERAFPVPFANTTIDYAELGSDAGFIGAAGCARLAYSETRLSRASA